MAYHEENAALIVIHPHRGMVERPYEDDESRDLLSRAHHELVRVIDKTRYHQLMPIIHIANISGPSGLLQGQQRSDLMNRLEHDASLAFLRGCKPQEHEMVFQDDAPSGYHTMASFLKENPWLKRALLAGFHTSCCVQLFAEDVREHTDINLALLTGATASVNPARTQEGIDALQTQGVELISPNQFNWMIGPENGYIYAPNLFAEQQRKAGTRIIHPEYPAAEPF